MGWPQATQQQQGRTSELVETPAGLGILAWRQSTRILKAYIHCFLYKENREEWRMWEQGSCRGVKEEVTLITGPFLQLWHSSLSKQRTWACPLESNRNVNVQESIFGRMWGVSLEVVGDVGRDCSNKESEAEHGRSVKDLCGGRMLLMVSPIRGTSVVLCALAGKRVCLDLTLFHCPVSSGGQRRHPVHSHWMLRHAWLGFGVWIFTFSPERPAKRICKDSKKKTSQTHSAACTLSQAAFIDWQEWTAAVHSPALTAVSSDFNKQDKVIWSLCLHPSVTFIRSLCVSNW